MNPDTMSSSITPSFVLFGTALVVWSVAASLSSYLGSEFERTHGEQSAQAGMTLAASANVDELRAATQQSDDAEPHVQLGYALLRDAREQENAQFLMDAVQSFNKALSIESEHPGALLGLAALSLQAGVIDKALEYYPRYLAVEPKDLRAKSDYGLALVQAEKFEESEELLQGILKEKSGFVPALMTLAYKRRKEGNLAEAKQFAEQALTNAEEEPLKANITVFLNDLSSEQGGPQTSKEQATVDSEQASPAVRVQNFFRSHSIIGPKLQRIRWESPTVAVVEVQDFPVEQMPPFAKQRFIQRVQEAFADMPEKLTFRIQDSKDGSQLLEIAPK